MVKPQTVFASAVAVALAVTSLFAQGERKRISPHEQVQVTVAGKSIKIDYGRPYLKGRKAIGGDLVPYGKVWRTGADEATMLTTEVDLMIGDLKVPAGSYSLFTLPSEEGWTLIVNKVAKQWGAFKYDPATDLGRVRMKVEKTPSLVEQFTISFEQPTAKSAILALAWENTKASVPVKVSE
jgi:Protein of unknown function (DUF2911).